MKVLIVGSGGREHAIGYKVGESTKVNKIYFAPGNGGTATLGENININVDNINGLKDFAQQNDIDITIVGPELPLALGIVDQFKEAGLKIFGPDKAGAQLESSKIFSKDFMKKYGIPTGDYQVFSGSQAAYDYLEKSDYPVVVKADGLAAGKGVIICENIQQAKDAVAEIMEEKTFGDSGSSIVIEEYLTGAEVSLICFTDSKTIVPMESASDYKRAYDNDEGLNTGGMGSISPSFHYENGSCDYIAEKTLVGIQKEGFDVRGMVYIGLMLTEKGPKVLEYNMRFGDPETQALLVRLDSDIMDIIIHTLDKDLANAEIKWSDKQAVTVVLAGEGYPGTPKKGSEIILPETPEDVIVFHSATKNVEGKLLSNGGRVLAVTGMGDTLETAREKCYSYIDGVTFPHSFYRKDIGKR